MTTRTVDSTQAPVENTTDATRGEPLAVRARKRRAELELAFATLSEDDLRARNDIDLAMSSLDVLLTGDLENLSQTTASEINRWLEHTKHLAETTPPARCPPA